MKLIFESLVTIPSISKTLSLLTDGSKISVNDIQYNEVDGTIVLVMRRRELMGFKKSFLGIFRPVYGQTMIDTVLTIKEVDEMEIKLDDRLIAECNSCFTALFGLNLDGNDLYLGSVEEAQGNALCQIFIKVKKIHIECFDKEKV